MKTKNLLFIGTLIGLSATVNAAFMDYDYRDANRVDAYLNQQSPTVSGTFNIFSDDGDAVIADHFGFDPVSQRITAADVFFNFVLFEGDLPSTISRFVFNLGSPSQPFAVGSSVIDLVFDFNFSGPVTGSLLLDLEEDGMLDWSVSVDQNFDGTVQLFAAGLGANAAAVPDNSATFALLGMSMLGLVVARRRLAA